MKPNLYILLLSIFFFGWSLADAQVVFSDDFSDNSDPAWTTSGNLSGSAWDVNRSGDDWGARRNDSPTQLELTNDVSGLDIANIAGYALVTTPTSSFSSPYSTTLSNGGVVTWTFNMRQIRPEPSGFNSTNYAVAFILAGENVTNNSTGSGYAVVLGEPGADSIRLVRYTGGLNADSDVIDIISSNTAGLTDLGLEYFSIKVVFNPCQGGVWELFVRNDGLTAFADPLSGTLTSQGTATNNTYTGIPLNMMAAYWKGSTTANQTAFFNNVTVSVTNIPAAVMGVNPIICSGLTSANLPYTGVTGSPNQYNIDWDAAAEIEGFVDVTNMALPSSPIVLTVPGGADPALYSGMLTLINTTTGCESDPYPISVTINAAPVVTCPVNITVCSDDPIFALTGGLPGGGMYSGPGVSSGSFNPGIAPAGDNIITYAYMAMNGCANNCTFTITVNTAPAVDAGTYPPACFDDPDIALIGTPPGGVWSGSGVTGNNFDPSYGTQNLTYTYSDMNGCGNADMTIISVSTCAAPSTMAWVLLSENLQNGPSPYTCTSLSDCDNDVICYGLEYTPLFTGVMTSYTTGFLMPCNNNSNPVVYNESCVMPDFSLTQVSCAGSGVLFNSSGQSGATGVVSGVPQIIHQVCFTIPATGVLTITKDIATGLTVSVDLTGGGFDTDTIEFYTPYGIDSSEDCTILPLTWLDFAARADGDLRTQLNWMTADEINNSHFEVQRSNDQGLTFRTIGRVEADTEVRSQHSYSFTDNNAFPGKNYYRLRQVDLDGRYAYSPLRSVSFVADGFGVKAWPNPAQDRLYVYIQQPEAGGQIELYDMAGRRVASVPYEMGANEHELILNGIQPGIFTLVVTSEENRYVEKITILE